MSAQYETYVRCRAIYELYIDKFSFKTRVGACVGGTKKEPNLTNSSSPACLAGDMVVT